MSLPQRRMVPNDYRGYNVPQTPPTALAPPPLPPRRRTVSRPVNGSMRSSIYGSPYGGVMVSPYSGGSMYGNMSSMGYPYSSMAGGYGYGGGYGAADPDSPFQSVESIVRAISSLSMMVESTYQSMYMSFRAVLGVADNMDQLRRVFFDIFGSMTLVKSFVWFVKKILYVVGLLKNNPVREKAWENAAAEVAGGRPAAAASRRTWPLVAFFGLMLGGPYVLYKLATPTSSRQWNPRAEGCIKCVAIYDFNTNQPGELPFKKGDVILRDPQAQDGWVTAVNKSGQMGLVPGDRLKAVSNIPKAPQRPPPGKPNLLQDYGEPEGVHPPFGPTSTPHVAVPPYDGPIFHPMATEPGSSELNPPSVPAAGTQTSMTPPAAPSQSAATPQPPYTDSPPADDQD